MSLFSLAGQSLKPLIKKVANEVAGKTTKPLMQKFAANAINDLKKEWFYGDYKIGNIDYGKRGAAAWSGVKGIGHLINQEINPVASKLYDTEGIPRALQAVARRQRAFLDSKPVTDVTLKKNRITTAKTKVTKLQKKLLREEDKEARKVFESDLKDAQKIINIPFSKKELKLIDKIKTSPKIIMGQALYNILQTNQQHKASKVLNELFLPENYYGKGDFNLKEFKGLKDIKDWESESILDDNIMSTLYRRIKEAQEIGDDEVVQMFVKKPYASRGAGNVANEIVKNATNSNKVFNILKDHKKPFDTIEELEKKLTKIGISVEKSDGVLFFKDSFKSSAYELGGVNVQNMVNRHGDIVSIVNDVNDIFKMKMPYGDNAISIVPPTIRNAFKSKENKKKTFIYKSGPKKGKRGRRRQTTNELSEEAWKLKEAEKRTELSKRLGVDEKRNIGLTGLTQNQRYSVDEIANMKPDNLTMKEWLAYLAKMGIVVGGPAYGLMSGEGQQQ